MLKTTFFLKKLTQKDAKEHFCELSTIYLESIRLLIAEIVETQLFQKGKHTKNAHFN
jgi:hypothetical protein